MSDQDISPDAVVLVADEPSTVLDTFGESEMAIFHLDQAFPLNGSLPDAINETVDAPSSPSTSNRVARVRPTLSPQGELEGDDDCSNRQMCSSLSSISSDEDEADINGEMARNRDRRSVRARNTRRGRQRYVPSGDEDEGADSDDDHLNFIFHGDNRTNRLLDATNFQRVVESSSITTPPGIQQATTATSSAADRSGRRRGASGAELNLNGFSRVPDQYLPYQLRPRIPSVNLRSPLAGIYKRHVDTNKPPKLRFGNRSFQPTAKFDTSPKAYPAKPDIKGFSSCHDKAAAARCVMSSIQNENSDDEEYTATSDLFNRFWIETSNFASGAGAGDASTSTAQRASIASQSQSEVREPSESARTSGNTPAAATSNNEAMNLFQPGHLSYEQWDMETSTLNNPLNYDLWNDIPETSAGMLGSQRSRNANNLTSTVGTGTGTENNNDYNNNARIRLSAAEIALADDLIAATASNRNQSSVADQDRQESRCMGGELFDETLISALFTLDFPNFPRLSRRASQDFPRSFLERAFFRGNQSVSSTSADEDASESEHRREGSVVTSNNANNSRDDDSDGGGSVFKMVVPEVDNTPSALFDGILSGMNNDEFPPAIEENVNNSDNLLMLPTRMENDNQMPVPPPPIDFEDML